MWEKLATWAAEQAAFSEYLSVHKHWTPLLKHIARTFLIIGCLLGFGEGVLLTLMIVYWLRGG